MRLFLLLSLAGCAGGAKADPDPCAGTGGWQVGPSDPAGSIQAALDEAAAAQGGTVWLASGVYAEPLRLGPEHDDVTLTAGCPGTVELHGGDPAVPVIEVAGDGPLPQVTLDGLTLTGGRNGVYASAGTVDLRDMVIADAGSGSTSLLAAGVFAAFGAVVDAQDLLVQRSLLAGIAALSEDTRVTVTRAEVSDTVRGPDGFAAAGLRAWPTAQIQGDVDVDGTDGDGVQVDGAGVILSGSHIRESAGYGVFVISGGFFFGTGLTLEGNGGTGIAADGASEDGTPSNLFLADSTLAGAGATDDPDNAGILVSGGATLAMEGGSLSSSPTVGLLADGVGTRAVVTGTTIEDTRPDREGNGGYGIGAQNGATVEVSEVQLQRNRTAGVLATDEGTTLTVADTLVANTTRGSTLVAAVGVAAQMGAAVDGAGVEVRGTEGPGLYVVAGSMTCNDCDLVQNAFAGALLTRGTLALTATRVEGTLPDAELGGGVGVLVTAQFGAPGLLLDGVDIGPQPYAALWLDGPGSYEVRDSELSGSTGVDVFGTTVHGNALFATGVGAWDGSSGLNIVDSALTNSAGAAVFLHDAAATLAGTRWSGNGVDVRQQHCVTQPALSPEQLDGAPVVAICPPADQLVDWSVSYQGLYFEEATSGG